MLLDVIIIDISTKINDMIKAQILVKIQEQEPQLVGTGDLFGRILNFKSGLPTKATLFYSHIVDGRDAGFSVPIKLTNSDRVNASNFVTATKQYNKLIGKRMPDLRDAQGPITAGIRVESKTALITYKLNFESDTY